MASSVRRRMGGGPGTGQWMVLGGAVLVILALTFALGLLVGRQWARQTVSTAAPSISEAARKPATPARRSGIAAETMADRQPESTEKLTFYQTLTEPLNGQGAPAKPEAKPIAIKAQPAPPPPSASLSPAPKVPAAQGKTSEAPLPPPTPVSLPPFQKAPAVQGKTTDGGSAGAISGPPPPTAVSLPGKTADGGSAGAISGPPQLKTTPPWTIQVGAFKSRKQADDMRQHLAASGVEAYVANIAAQDGGARFRVRIGTYRTREDAAAAADRLRGQQRSLTAFVTIK